MTRVGVRGADDGGVTLVEVLVYVLVTVLVLGGLTALFVNAWLADTRARERDTATGFAQLLTASVQNSVRNAAGTPDISSDGKLLRARVATGGAGWECRGWVLDASGDFRYLAQPQAIAEGSYTEAAGWTTIASGIAGSGTGGAVFAMGRPREVQLSVIVTVGEATLPVTGGATAQASGIPGDGSEVSCVPVVPAP